MGDRHDARADHLGLGTSELESKGGLDERSHLLRLGVVGDADDRDLGLLDQLIEGADAAAVTSAHAVDLVHDKHRLGRQRDRLV